MNEHPSHPSGTHSQHPTHSPGIHPSPSPARAGIAPMPHMPGHQDSLASIELVDDLSTHAGPTPVSKIRALQQESMHTKRREFTRVPFTSGQGAIRMKSFHGKYSDQGLEYLDDVVNDWIDHHPEVEVKFVTSTVGIFEGKIREPAIVLNLWY